MDDAERLERLKTLLAIDERITALEASKGERKPWWKNAALIAAYGGLLALVPAFVTGVAGWFENQRELELESRKQKHERTLAYLGLAVDPESTEAARAQVLRFLASLRDDPVGEWAAAELDLVNGKIAELKDEKEAVIADVEVADAKAKAAESAAAQLQAEAETDPKNTAVVKQAAAKTAEAQHLMADVRRRRDRLAALSTRTGDAPLEIIQLREAKGAQLQLPETTTEITDPVIGPPRRMK
ncbi:MAG TPA: hypothetical protein VG755_23540 [Nannocystaceae bacterium]|nr:hypothetical protein [Nannocystaceae bacterium]